MLADETQQRPIFTVIQRPIDHLNGVAQLAPSGLSDHYYSYGCMDLILLPSMQLPAACIACVSRSGVCVCVCVCVCVWTLENRSAWHGCLFCSSMAKEEEGSK